jgi:hypothetical protein
MVAVTGVVPVAGALVVARMLIVTLLPNLRGRVARVVFVLSVGIL